ncbi:GH1 family beta-glucosidase [Leadbettera azotonutricia]|uniref:Beta-glucosidase n=1 Tax=Leadbettera azotonutricia (strain ATCC BAA-888 / DSM 13862 / ZAS-9) TaxID=545695 RepID=F5Y9D3_LEAAZ|nr:GH1 family beta-glucosidase [Leadbettera azotonutricia]AEF80244.1 beta-galactosidase [Leadbettera azotonutricia ZAS-9]
MPFRKDFIWGGASASYQVEGAAHEDGRGPSVWDMFCKQEGKVLNEASGDMACDHYHRYQEDVDIMKELGYKAYRFSIAWPRIIPDGDGPVNSKGLDFYDRLLDSLLKVGVTPYATLFHWDYPYALFRKGGWMNPSSPQWFADYTSAVAKRLGDRLKNYFTMNEPQCFIGISYDTTEHAPGIHFPIWDTLLMAHNVLLGHGRAVQALRALVPDAKIGYAPTGSAHYPASDDPMDREAARKAYFAVEERTFWSVSLWSDPVFLGKYPDELLARHGQHMPKIGPEDMSIISQKIDFLGQNIYNGAPVRCDGKGGYEYVPRKQGYAFTAAKWPVTPEALYWGPTFLWERYKTPIFITENGLSCQDVVSLDGKVHDPNRIDFLSRYLRCLRKASEDGADIRGYFHWCVTDNFEWAKGYTDRFGMVYCDFETQKRIIKDSGYWYRDMIKVNGENL